LTIGLFARADDKSPVRGEIAETPIAGSIDGELRALGGLVAAIHVGRPNTSGDSHDLVRRYGNVVANLLFIKLDHVDGRDKPRHDGTD
jgi:hypothetical protein